MIDLDTLINFRIPSPVDAPVPTSVEVRREQARDELRFRQAKLEAQHRVNTLGFPRYARRAS